MRTPSFTLLSVVAFALATAVCPGAEADANPGQASPKAAAGEESALMKILTRDYMLGDWWGKRTELAEKGIDFEFFYIASNPHVIQGGIKPGTAYHGGLAMMVDFDTEKLVGLHGGNLHAASALIHGRQFSPRHIGDFNKVSLIDFQNTFRLWELWYEQRFLKDKVSLKFGQLAVDKDFLVPTVSRVFQNQTFFFPTLAFNVFDIPAPFPQLQHSLASSPFGAPGVRLRVDPTERFYVQVGAYDGNPDMGYTGTRVNLNDNEGALFYFETGFKLNQREQDTGLPGNYKIGGFLHTDEFADNYETLGGFFGLSHGNAPLHSETFGAYLLAEQTLFREVGREDPAQQGMSAFFRLAGAPSDRNLTEFEIDGGLVYKGLFPSRDWDSIGIAASYLQMSKELRRAQRDANTIVPGAFPTLVDYEAVIEATYKAQITPWFTIQPSIEWALNPGGTRGNRDAVAFVLQSTFRF